MAMRGLHSPVISEVFKELTDNFEKIWGKHEYFKLSLLFTGQFSPSSNIAHHYKMYDADNTLLSMLKKIPHYDSGEALHQVFESLRGQWIDKCKEFVVADAFKDAYLHCLTIFEAYYLQEYLTQLPGGRVSAEIVTVDAILEKYTASLKKSIEEPIETDYKPLEEEWDARLATWDHQLTKWQERLTACLSKTTPDLKHEGASPQDIMRRLLTEEIILFRDSYRADAFDQAYRRVAIDRSNFLSQHPKTVENFFERHKENKSIPLPPLDSKSAWPSLSVQLQQLRLKIQVKTLQSKLLPVQRAVGVRDYSKTYEEKGWLPGGRPEKATQDFLTKYYTNLESLTGGLVSLSLGGQEQKEIAELAKQEREIDEQLSKLESELRSRVGEVSSAENITRMRENAIARCRAQYAEKRSIVREFDGECKKDTAPIETYVGAIYEQWEIHLKTKQDALIAERLLKEWLEKVRDDLSPSKWGPVVKPSKKRLYNAVNEVYDRFSTRLTALKAKASIEAAPLDPFSQGDATRQDEMATFPSVASLLDTDDSSPSVSPIKMQPATFVGNQMPQTHAYDSFPRPRPRHKGKVSVTRLVLSGLLGGVGAAVIGYFILGPVALLAAVGAIGVAIGVIGYAIQRVIRTCCNRPVEIPKRLQHVAALAAQDIDFSSTSTQGRTRSSSARLAERLGPRVKESEPPLIDSHAAVGFSSDGSLLFYNSAGLPLDSGGSNRATLRYSRSPSPES